MDRIYLFLIRNAVWIYIVCAFGLVWYTTELIRAQAALRRAMFNLERETATRVRNHALSFVLFLGAVVGIVYYVNAYVAPTLPEEIAAEPTPTPDIFATPLPSPTPLGTPLAEGELDAPIVLAPTATLPGQVAAEPITDTVDAEATAALPTPFSECIPELRIDEPLNGGVAFGRVAFRGTANTGELHQYVIEMQGPQTQGEWAPVISQEPLPQPVVNGDLGNADLSLWGGGPYLVRLRALDPAGTELGVCTIQITLDN
jgi:hypothetical protein